METVDILIKNANELITLEGPKTPRKYEQMNDLAIIRKGSVAIKDGKIIETGIDLNYKAKKIIDASGKIVMPGFVDPHTHLVFAGSREFELDMKLRGLTYIEILKKGGGIFYTVNKTREATIEELIEQSKDLPIVNKLARTAIFVALEGSDILSSAKAIGAPRWSDVNV